MLIFIKTIKLNTYNSCRLGTLRESSSHSYHELKFFLLETSILKRDIKKYFMFLRMRSEELLYQFGCSH